MKISSGLAQPLEFHKTGAIAVLKLFREDYMSPLDRITERVMRNGNPEERGVAVPLLTLEEFFEGNDHIGSIGCNLDSEPTPQEFYEFLTALRSKPQVSDVRVQITCVDDPGVEWPFSDTVWIITSADEETVRGWFPDTLAPDDVWTGWTTGVQFEEVAVADSHKPIAIWFD